MALAFMEGNEAIARGAVAAGCNFFAGYPITPATTIFNNMLKMLPPAGGVCIQGEDEIASMGILHRCSHGREKGADRHFGAGHLFVLRAYLLCHRQRDSPGHC